MARIFCLFLLAAAAMAQGPAPARQLYRELNALRVDAAEIYFVRELHLRRDVLRFSFTEGKLAFLQGHRGRVLGAVFTGSGRVLAMPRDISERYSLGRFLGAPLLDQPFTRAYFRFTDDTAAELRRQLEHAGARRLAEPSFAETWNLALTDLNPWHSLRAMMDLEAAAPQPYFFAGLQNQQWGGFSVVVDERREEQVTIGQSQWLAGQSVHDVWASFSREGRAAPTAPPFLPLHVAIETTIHPDLELEARAALRLRATGEGERFVSLELSRALRVEQVTGADGRALEFFQNEDIRDDELRQRGNDSLLVALPAPARQGQEVRLAVAYRGRVISDAGNGNYFVGARGSWYPNAGWMQHFVPFELSFRWPARLRLVATGRKLEEREEGDWRAGRWESEKPIPVAGFNLGDYLSETVEAEGWGIEIFANRRWEAAVLQQLRRPVVVPAPPVVVQPSGRPGRPAPRVMLIERPPPQPGAILEELGQNLAQAIRFYEDWLGPFPFERLAVSQIPGSFGQGWPGLLYLSTLSFLEPADQQRAGMGERAQLQYTEVMPFHEVAHQWWGNTVSWSSYRDQWIHEALAEYMALLYADAQKPEAKLLERWLEAYRAELTTASGAAGQTPESAGPLVLGYRLNSSKSPGAYRPVVYGKGAWVVHMIRQMLRDPGAAEPDARFRQLLRALAGEYRHRPLRTEDLEREVGRLLPEEMDLEENGRAEWFFDQWVRGVGIPRYKAEFQVTPRGQAFRVRGTLRQSGVPEVFLAAVPLYAAGAGGRPVRLGTVFTFGPETTFEFPSRIRPRRLLVDPENTLLRIVE